MGLCCVVVNRLLYAIGGYDGTNRLKSGVVYTPEKNTWTDIAPMNTARSGAGNNSIQFSPNSMWPISLLKRLNYS